MTAYRDDQRPPASDEHARPRLEQVQEELRQARMQLAQMKLELAQMRSTTQVEARRGF